MQQHYNGANNLESAPSDVYGAQKRDTRSLTGGNIIQLYGIGTVMALHDEVVSYANLYDPRLARKIRAFETVTIKSLEQGVLPMPYEVLEEVINDVRGVAQGAGLRKEERGLNALEVLARIYLNGLDQKVEETTIAEMERISLVS